MTIERSTLTVGDVVLEYSDNEEATLAAQIIAKGLPEEVGVRFETYYADGDHWGVTISRILNKVIFEPDPVSAFGYETASSWRNNPYTTIVGGDM